MMLGELKAKLGKKWPIFEGLHKFIMSLNSKMRYRVFTIYITYYLEEKVIAVVYFRGKFVSDCELNIGFAFREKPNTAIFDSANYMQYPGINYGIKINSREDITGEITKTIKLNIIK